MYYVEMKSDIQSFLEYKEHRLAITTRQAYAGDLAKFYHYLIEHDISSWNDIDFRVIEGFLENTFTSQKTANRKLSSIRSLFSYLVRNGVTEKNPSLIAERYKQSKRIGRSLNKFQLDILRSNCENVLEKVIIEIFICTGIRVSELVGLNLSSIDSVNRQLLVLGKGEKERLVYVTDRCLDLINSYLVDRHAKSGEQALFTNSRGWRINRWKVAAIIKELGKRCGIPDVVTRKVYRGEKDVYLHPHLFRHTFASLAIADGVDLKQVQDWMGHEKISTTDEYVHTTKKSRDDYDRVYKNI